uniref:Uncharacterized protein n=1 Tax=Pectinophora gossypiella TaxID=13191 RepID=A0A1E1VYP3_PECGO
MLQDVPQQMPQQMRLHPNYQLLVNAQKQVPINRNIPLPVINLLQAVPNKQIIRTPVNQVVTQELTKNAMTPLSLNIGSPMYSLPSSPNTNYSPVMSPAQRERVLSPYSTPQSLSPIGRYQRSPSSRLVSPVGMMQGSDPYLTNKMQPSPPFPMQTSDFLDSSVSLTSPDFWTEPELQGTNDLLTAFDDVKLV